jgi:hypothetical protein
MSSAEDDESTGQKVPSRREDAGADDAPEATGEASRETQETPRSDDGENHPRSDPPDHDSPPLENGSPLETAEAELPTPSTSSSDEAVLDSPQPGLVENDDVTDTTVASDAEACPENEHETPEQQLLGNDATSGSTPSPTPEELAIPTPEDSDPELTRAAAGTDTAETTHASSDGDVNGLGNDIGAPSPTDAPRDVSKSSSDGQVQEPGEDNETPAEAETTQGSSQLPTMAPDASSNGNAPEPPPYEDSPSTIRLRQMDDKSAARQQWILRKEEDREDNEALDEMMLVFGFEDVKAQFLSVYDEARAARKRGDDLQTTKNLDVCFVEGDDASKWTSSASAATTPEPNSSSRQNQGHDTLH